MPIFRVALGRLVREILVLDVETSDIEHLEDRLTFVYDEIAGTPLDASWQTDVEWGAEEGEHVILSRQDDLSPDIVIDDDGNIHQRAEHDESAIVPDERGAERAGQ